MASFSFFALASFSFFALASFSFIALASFSFFALASSFFLASSFSSSCLATMQSPHRTYSNDFGRKNPSASHSGLDSTASKGVSPLHSAQNAVGQSTHRNISPPASLAVRLQLLQWCCGHCHPIFGRVTKRAHPNDIVLGQFRHRRRSAATSGARKGGGGFTHPDSPPPHSQQRVSCRDARSAALSRACSRAAAARRSRSSASFASRRLTRDTACMPRPSPASMYSTVATRSRRFPSSCDTHKSAISFLSLSAFFFE